MSEQHGWAVPGSGDLPPGWSSEQPPPFRPGAPGGPGPAGPGGPGGPGWRGPGPGAPKPGIVPLRPLGLGELLDGAFTGIRRNPRATLGLAAILMTIAAVAQAVVSFYLVGQTTSLAAQPTQAITSDELYRLLSQTLGTLSISILVQIISTTVLTGMLTTVFGSAVLGRPISMAQAWRAVRPRLWRLLGVTLLTTVIMLGVVAVGVAIPVGLAVAGAPTVLWAVAAVICAVLVICASVFCFVVFTVCTPAVMLEDTGVLASVRRSYRLTIRSFWRVLLIMVLTELIVIVVGGVLQTPFSLGQLPMMLSDDPSTGQQLLSVVLSTIGAIISTTITMPFVAGVGALLYVDLRMRREGLDLQLRTATEQDGEADFATLWRPSPGPDAPPVTTPPGAGPPPPADG